MIIYTFIDTQNLLKTLKEMNLELDFQRFYDYCVTDLKSNKCILFFGYTNRNEVLYQKLRDIGFELVFRPMYNGKANVDSDIVLHVVDRQEQFDKAILVSNDGDFYNLILYIKSKNKFKNIISPSRRSCSKLLRKVADNKIIFLDDLYSRMVIRNTP